MMTAHSDLRRFWEMLETNFPPAAPRKHLAERIGRGLVALLERGGILAYIREAETYPCPQPGGPGCPRQVIQHSSGQIAAVCGNDPRECEEIQLAAKDIEVLAVLPERLCEALRGPLLFGGKIERATGLNHTIRAGTFVPRAGLRQAIYFATRCSAGEYGVLLDVLKSRHGPEGFALLVPTDRFVSEDTIRMCRTCGIVVLPLAGLINVDAAGILVAGADATDLFSGIGRFGPGPIAIGQTVFAQVCTRGGWQNLDEAGYREFMGAADQYDIFADEHTKAVRKKVDKPQPKRTRVPAVYFQMLRKALETPGYYDPVTDQTHEDRLSAKQIFQRARQTVDIKVPGASRNAAWRLFKTEIVDKRSVYRFQPEPEVSFALIFLPKT